MTRTLAADVILHRFLQGDRDAVERASAVLRRRGWTLEMEHANDVVRLYNARAEQLAARWGAVRPLLFSVSMA
jgi:hypothetical protein